jgi:hypothetical protein
MQAGTRDGATPRNLLIRCISRAPRAHLTPYGRSTWCTLRCQALWRGRRQGMNPTQPAVRVTPKEKEQADARRDTLSVTDNRTGKTFELPVSSETIRALDLRPMKVQSDDLGLMSYDPAFTNTASSVTAATQSRNWPKKAPISRPPISFFMASCRVARNLTSGPTTSTTTRSFMRALRNS